MEGESTKETMKGVASAHGEFISEAVSGDIVHPLFVGDGRDGAAGEGEAEGTVEEGKVGEAAADMEVGLGEGLDIGLGVG